MDISELLTDFFITIIASLITGTIGVRIADSKGRSGKEGFLLGFFLSVVGIIIEAVLPRAEVRNVSGGLHLDRQNRKLRKCPHCAEMVLAEANICRYCNRDLPSTVSSSDDGPRFQMVGERQKGKKLPPKKSVLGLR
jgi:hypothetical protein